MIYHPLRQIMRDVSVKERRWAAEEIAERRAQIAWLRRRCPTARERLASRRRAHARWTARRAG